MRVALLFPGQGAQEPGMLARLPASPAAQATLAEASEALGRDVRALDTAEALAGTAATQLALLIAGVAAARALAAEGVGPDVVAGHSVGAFAAAVTADVLALGDAVRAVALRGALMAAAYPQGYGMAAVIGLPERRLVAAGRRGAHRRRRSTSPTATRRCRRWRPAPCARSRRSAPPPGAPVPSAPSGSRSPCRRTARCSSRSPASLRQRSPASRSSRRGWPMPAAAAPGSSPTRA